ncbi:MAG: ion channel [Thermoplasmatales archaeon]
MEISVRLGKISTVFYILYVLILLSTVYYLASSTYRGVLPLQLYGLVNPLVITFIFSIIGLRGLIVRVRYSLYLSIATTLATILPFLVVNRYLSIYTIPLLAFSIVAMILLFRNHKYYNFPTRLFARPEISISIIIIVVVLLIGVAGTLILGDQFSPKITDVSRALYYTGEVVTTLGFGDILPITRTSQIFSIMMSILGIGSFFGAVTVIVGPLIYERGKRVVRVIQKIESKMLNDYILFVDFTPLFEPLLRDLIHKDELVIIALDDKAKESLVNEKNVFVETDGNMEKILSTLDLARAKRIVLGSSDDGRNIMNALYITTKHPGEEVKKKTIAIVNVPTNLDRIVPLVGGIISPANLIAEHSKTLF